MPASMTTLGDRGTTSGTVAEGAPAVLEKGQPQRFNAYNSPHEDLREFIKRAEEAGEIVRIKGADPHLEMGTLGEIVNHARPEAPALLFEDVPGYPKGMRLISGATNSSKRLAITHGPAGAVLPARRGEVLSRAHAAAQADPAEDRAHRRGVRERRPRRRGRPA